MSQAPSDGSNPSDRRFRRSRSSKSLSGVRAVSTPPQSTPTWSSHPGSSYQVTHGGTDSRGYNGTSGSSHQAASDGSNPSDRRLRRSRSSKSLSGERAVSTPPQSTPTWSSHQGSSYQVTHGGTDSRGYYGTSGSGHQAATWSSHPGSSYQVTHGGTDSQGNYGTSGSSHQADSDGSNPSDRRLRRSRSSKSLSGERAVSTPPQSTPTWSSHPGSSYQVTHGGTDSRGYYGTSGSGHQAATWSSHPGSSYQVTHGGTDSRGNYGTSGSSHTSVAPDWRLPGVKDSLSAPPPLWTMGNLDFALRNSAYPSSNAPTWRLPGVEKYLSIPPPSRAIEALDLETGPNNYNPFNPGDWQELVDGKIRTRERNVHSNRKMK